MELKSEGVFQGMAPYQLRKQNWSASVEERLERRRGRFRVVGRHSRSLQETLIFE